jgi:hypothetical protein
VKSDDIDAVRAARQVLAGVGLGEPRRRGDREAIRVLLTTRAQAVEFRTRAISALHALVTSAPDVIRERLRTLPLGQLNRALHTIVLVRMRQDSATKDYVQRRLAQGKTIRDIKRCLIGEVSVMRPGIGLDRGFSVVSGDGLVAEPL